ncbi:MULTISPECIES: helix-turn-helix domain-containing protein [Amycolatopsis]|uniref:Helix-turn-helix transcriptional regulator n=1 Tax=Amycolatopsis echigonensis TaxID=2576905 RepID=A0A2N3WNH5_9PSEU|nr:MULTISPECIES: helix-turn-helix transcriptional regulator [Amycolatopsis]MBB2498377.1 helix-turn-helix transcriptional regulator [Amycolatopsis echigonensis]PKV95421.1 regulatory LuxR family protein [Amycolatopsis niigatensis]
MAEQTERQGPVFVGADPEALTRARDYLEAKGIALTSISRPVSPLQVFVRTTAIDEARARTGVISDSSLLQLRMIAGGMTNAEIGNRLGRSENTVKASLKALFRAIGARDRAHAVLIGCRAGLI